MRRPGKISSTPVPVPLAIADSEQKCDGRYRPPKWQGNGIAALPAIAFPPMRRWLDKAPERIRKQTFFPTFLTGVRRPQDAGLSRQDQPRHGNAIIRVWGLVRALPKNRFSKPFLLRLSRYTSLSPGCRIRWRHEDERGVTADMLLTNVTPLRIRTALTPDILTSADETKRRVFGPLWMKMPIMTTDLKSGIDGFRNVLLRNSVQRWEPTDHSRRPHPAEPLHSFVC